jgi:hypothetical protein
MAGMKFRKSCDLCNVTFFTPNRNALYCAKCAKKMGVADAVAPQPQAAKGVRVAVAEPGKAKGGVGAAVAAKARGPVLVKKAKKGPRPPKPTELSDEIKQRIVQAFREAQGQSASVRELHAQLAEKLWVRRWMVAEVIQELSQHEAKLTPELRADAVEMYRDFVENHERPAGGRRKAIATKLGVPAREVIFAVRDWAKRQEAESPNPKLSRQHLFEIEKAYWDEMDRARYPLSEFPERLSAALGFANRWQILRWIDVLHDDPRSFDGVPDPSDEQRQAVLDAYRRYLESEGPPDKGLHQTIADELGDEVKPRQVHKVLQVYRHTRRADYRSKA